MIKENIKAWVLGMDFLKGEHCFKKFFMEIFKLELRWFGICAIGVHCVGLRHRGQLNPMCRQVFPKTGAQASEH